MQFTQCLIRLTLILLLPTAAVAQTTYLQQGDKQNTFLERLEIKAQNDSVLNYSKNRAYSRKYNVSGVNSYLAKYGQESLSAVDKYNLRSFYMNNTEWLTDEEREQYKSKKNIWNTFYKTPANFYEVHVKDFDLIVNPILQLNLSKQNDNNQRLFQNTRGLSIRGKIANKIGFTAMVTENQERPPSYVQQFITDRQAVPGAGYYKRFKAAGGVDYFDARGYFTFNATKYIDVSFGYDKHFIGNGHRSLFLSDFGNNNLFLKLNTRIWKFNYQNIFMELNNAYQRGGDRLLGKKYAAVHHLDINVTKWLNVGLFEGVVFGRENRFEFGYLNPVIFYRSVEQQNGSEDNALAGIDFKANVAKKVQLYGQLLLDEFKLNELKDNNGWWANKWGIQAGVKYIDAFTIKNLDLQVEYNRVRPFTYSHRDSVANFTHYNQPMAHPLMANFSEVIGILRYQPIPKLMITGKLIAYTQGRDSSAQSFGSNIFLPNRPPFRTGDYGYKIGSGWKTNVLYGSLLASYEVLQNMFIDASVVLRRLETKTRPIMEDNTSIITVGLRWNMMRREYDF